jgi:hypothetical protein
VISSTGCARTLPDLIAVDMAMVAVLAARLKARDLFKLLTPFMKESRLLSMTSISSQKIMLNVWWWGS